MESSAIPGSIVIVGIGQMASVLSFGLLRLGHPVIPVTRSMSMSPVASFVPHPELVLVAVGEDELEGVLSAMPLTWRDRIALLQNELRPATWSKHSLPSPTILCAWFEKKKGIEVRALRPSPVFGPGAALLVRASSASDVPALVGSEAQLATELAKKNLYILTTNIVGLAADRTILELVNEEATLLEQVFHELFELESRLLAAALDLGEQTRSLHEAFQAAPGRRARGRTAPARLQRALRAADRFGLEVPKLREISKKI